MKTLNKHILESINRGIRIALDDFEESDLINDIHSKDEIINNDQTIFKKYMKAIFEKTFIDLGLPSGTLWARYNLGVDINLSKINNQFTHKKWYGNYYMWGDIITRKTYNHITYNYLRNSNAIKYGDVHTKLELSDDIAYITYSAMPNEYICHIPNREQISELYNNTHRKWIENYNNVQGLNGIEFTSDKNNNKIFFPAGGFYEGDVLNNIGSKCYYWTSELCFFNENGYAFILDEQNNIISNENPWFGYNIRPVIELKSNYENNE